MTTLASALHERVDDLRGVVLWVAATYDRSATVAAARTHLA